MSREAKIKKEDYTICPKCGRKLMFNEKMSDCWCSNKKCDFGKKRLVIKFN